jgi:hypothetical protein
MGARGPLPNPNSRRSAAKSGRKAPDSAATGQVLQLSVSPPAIPAAPSDLRASGKRIWAEFWACPWAQDSDRTSVMLLCRLEDERDRMLRHIGSALTLERPIVSPKGTIVGQDLVSHPLLRDLRRLDPVIVQLRDRLGLTPAARGRLHQPIVAQNGRPADAEKDRVMAGYRQAIQ